MVLSLGFIEFNHLKSRFFEVFVAGREVSWLLGLSLHLRQLLQILGCLSPGESMVAWEPLGTLPRTCAEEVRGGG